MDFALEFPPFAGRPVSQRALLLLKDVSQPLESLVTVLPRVCVELPWLGVRNSDMA